MGIKGVIIGPLVLMILMSFCIFMRRNIAKYLKINFNIYGSKKIVKSQKVSKVPHKTVLANNKHFLAVLVLFVGFSSICNFVFHEFE